jgi:phage tail sheath protein FI
MAASFLHGVETVTLKTGTRPITTVRTAVIALVGIAPEGDKNVLKLVSSPNDAAQFGSPLPGFNIPKALEIIFSYGVGTVLVVNTFDSATNTAQVTAESRTVLNSKFKLAFAPIGAVTLTNTGAIVTYVKDTDYKIDAYGNVTLLPGSAMVEGQSVLVTYKKLDASTVNATQLVGEINSTTEVRTGMKLFETAYNTFGVKPKVIIAPGYSNLSGIVTEMVAQAGKFRAIYLLDAPAATTVAGAITARGPAGTIAGWNTSNTRAMLLYPMVKTYDKATLADANTYFSSLMAGLIGWNDNQNGYWFSPSNKELAPATGVERYVVADISDANCEANRLNEVGITTVFSSYGTGIRSWGNRSAAWPTVTTPENFISIQRTFDIVADSVELASLQFMDQPINNALIDAIVESVNSFIRTLTSRGALIEGSKAFFDPAKNPETEIALGHLTISRKLMAPTPAERLTYEDDIDITLLNNVIPQ